MIDILLYFIFFCILYATKFIQQILIDNLLVFRRSAKYENKFIV